MRGGQVCCCWHIANLRHQSGCPDILRAHYLYINNVKRRTEKEECLWKRPISVQKNMLREQRLKEMKQQAKLSIVSLTVLLFLCLRSLYCRHTNTHTPSRCCPNTYVTSSVDLLSWKHTCEFTKTELQPSLNSSICPSPSFISFLLSYTHIHTQTHTHAEQT